MTISRGEYENLPELEQARHQEIMLDYFNDAFFKVREKNNRREIVDLINIYTSLRYDLRLRKITDQQQTEYRMFTPYHGTHQAKHESDYLQGKLDEIMNKKSKGDRPPEIPTKSSLDPNNIDIVLAELCNKFVDDEISREEYVDCLAFIVGREAEIELLKRTREVQSTELTEVDPSVYRVHY